MPDFAFILAGFAVGLIVGLTGVGGGSVMAPVLIFFFGVKPHWHRLAVCCVHQAGRHGEPCAPAHRALARGGFVVCG